MFIDLQSSNAQGSKSIAVRCIEQGFIGTENNKQRKSDGIMRVVGENASLAQVVVFLACERG